MKTYIGVFYAFFFNISILHFQSRLSHNTIANKVTAKTHYNTTDDGLNVPFALDNQI